MTRRPQPRDPRVQALIAQAKAARSGGRAVAQPAAGLTRRNFLAGGAGLAGTSALLAACGTGGASPSGGATSAAPAEATNHVRWANWTLYLDYDDRAQIYPTLERFTEETGITVDYFEDIDGNDTFFGSISGQLANGQDCGYDIVTFTDRTAAQMINLGYTQELDLANIPNHVNLLESLRDVDFDPGRHHCLTWQSGFAGIAWNKEQVPDGLGSVSDLWAPELAGRVIVLDEMRDTMGLIMLDQGVDISGDWGDDEFYAAIDQLTELVSSGQIREVKGNAYVEDLISGNALAVIGWSGDIIALNFENTGEGEEDKWEFALPEGGGTLWSDNLLVPVGSPNKAAAEELINFYYDPEVAAEVAAYVNFITPVEGAREAIVEIDPELADSWLIFPDDETLANAHAFRSLSAEEETAYNEAFQSAIGN